MRSANGNLVRTREWHQIKCFHQYLMVRPHQAEWKALHQSKAQWLADMLHYSPSLPHDRALDLFNEHFERMENKDLFRMRFNRRSANPLEWISVDFFSKGRALDPSFLRFLMGMTWQMKTPAFRATVSLEEFVRDRTEKEDKQAKDTFLLAHRFLYDSCPHGLRLEVAGAGEGAIVKDEDMNADAERRPTGQQEYRIMAQLKEWEDRGLVIALETSPTKKIFSLAREALDLITYDSPLLPSILRAMTTQRPEATQQYRRIIAKEANSRTCFFRLHKNSRFLTLFGPLKPDLAALIETAPASYYSSSSAPAASGAADGGCSRIYRSSNNNIAKQPRARGSVYRGFRKRPYADAVESSSLKKCADAAVVKKSCRLPKREEDDFYYYDDNDDLGDTEGEGGEEEETAKMVGKQEQRKKEEGGGQMSLEMALGIINAVRPSHHQYHCHTQISQHQPWAMPTATMTTVKAAAVAPHSRLLSPADDLTTSSSSSSAASCSIETYSGGLSAWAQEPWMRELDDCLNRWFPHTLEGDDTTMYEPPVDPDDVFEKWCRENLVLAGEGMAGNYTSNRASNCSSITNISSTSSSCQIGGKDNSAATSSAASVVLMDEHRKVSTAISTARSTAFSSLSTTVATQVEEMIEEREICNGGEGTQGGDVGMPLIEEEKQQHFCSLMLEGFLVTGPSK
ncbi:Hypothetical protein NocV09_01100080 [Nannochloropsis oceanica]